MVSFLACMAPVKFSYLVKKKGCFLNLISTSYTLQVNHSFLLLPFCFLCVIIELAKRKMIMLPTVLYNYFEGIETAFCSWNFVGKADKSRVARTRTPNFDVKAFSIFMKASDPSHFWWCLTCEWVCSQLIKSIQHVKHFTLNDFYVQFNILKSA